MLGSLICYDRQNRVVATLDHMVRRDERGDVVGLVDFPAHELAGGKLRDIVDVQALDAPVPLAVAREVLGRDPDPGEQIVLPAMHPFRVAHDKVVGAGAWPEWLGARARDFTVELRFGAGLPRVLALVHKKSGRRRERGAIEAAIRARQDEAYAAADAMGVERARVRVDLRDLVGGPDRPLLLDDDGKTVKRGKVEVPALPYVVTRGQGNGRH